MRYEYECPVCRTRRIVTCPIKDRNDLVKCWHTVRHPHTQGAITMKRMLQPTPFVIR